MPFEFQQPQAGQHPGGPAHGDPAAHGGPPYGTQPYGAQPYAAAPVSYYNPVGRPGRPTSVTVLAVLGIVFAGISLLNNLGGVVLYGAVVAGGRRSPVLAVPAPALNLIGSVVSACLAGWLLVAAIAAIRLRPWAPASLRAYAGTYLVWIVVWGVMSLGYILPENIAPRRGGPALPAGADSMMYAGAAFVLLLMAVYPICLLAFMSRPHVVAAFAGAAPAGVPAYQYPPPSPPGQP